MTFLIILIIFVICWPWIAPWIRRQVNKFMARRAEDMFRRMMGMPSSREERRQAKQQSRQSGKSRASAFSGRPDDYEEGHGVRGNGRRRGRRGNYSIARLMQLVAVDVSYTEIKEFGSTVIGEDGAASIKYSYEEQITDVKFTEIKGG